MRKFPIYGFSLIWQSWAWNDYRRQCSKCRHDRYNPNHDMCGKHKFGCGYLFRCDGFCDRMYKWTDKKRDEEWNLPDGDPVVKEKWLRSLGRGLEADDFIRNYGNEEQKAALNEKEERMTNTVCEVIRYLNKQNNEEK